MRARFLDLARAAVAAVALRVLVSRGRNSLTPRLGRKRGAWRCRGAVLEAGGQLDQGGLGPAAADEVDPDRELAERVAAGHGQVGVAGHRRRGRAAEQEVVAVDQVGGPGRAGGEAEDGVQVEAVHGRVDALAGDPLGGRQGLQVGRVVQAAGGLGEQEDLLAEPAQLPLGVGLVEGDQVGQGPHRGVAQLRQVGGDVGLELVQEHGELGVARRRRRWGCRPGRPRSRPAG